MCADTILCVGGGVLQTYLIREAQALGYAVIVTDQDGAAPGMALAQEAYVIDTYDVERHRDLVRFLRGRGISLAGVVTCGADVAPTVSAAADEAHVAGIPYPQACLTHNKWRVRQVLDMAGFARYQPAWMEMPLPLTPPYLETVTYSVGPLPWVVKPLRQCASRGVSIVRTPEGIDDALAQAAVYGDQALVERCLTGTEHSAEIVLDDGHTVWRNVVDRLFDYSTGVPIEIGHVNPSRFNVLQWDVIFDMMRQAAAALGITWGPFKADIMWTEDGPKILEVTARLSGGFDCQRTSPMTCRHPIRQYLAMACRRSDAEQGYWLTHNARGAADGYAACAAILPPRQGVVTHLMSSSDDLVWLVQPGAIVGPPAHCAQRAGFAFAHAATYDAAWTTAQARAAQAAAGMQIAVTGEMV